MTEKLYYADVCCQKFTAAVTDCREGKHGYEVVLDRTAFYPEGGGQPGDRGVLYVIGQDTCRAEGMSEKGTDKSFEAEKEAVQVISGCCCNQNGASNSEISSTVIEVTDAHEKDGEILHFTSTYLAPGTIVAGQIDWEYRFNLMQNHSGEHIVSGLIHEKYGYQNVGFHMGSDVLTVDLDGELTMHELQEIELRANEIIWRDLPVETAVYGEEEVKALTYRSKKELQGQVRIVTIPGADTCACCGTHVRRTGEIGLIKLISAQKFRGGVRMEMLCGRRALAYMNELWEQNRQISVTLSAKPKETAAAVQRLKEAEADVSFRMNALENELFAKKAESLQNAGNVLLFEEGLAPDSVRRLAVAVMERCGGLCAVFSGNDEEGYKYAVGQKDGDLRAFIKEMNTALNGRGGGKPFFAQGSVMARKAKIEGFFKEKVCEKYDR